MIYLYSSNISYLSKEDDNNKKLLNSISSFKQIKYMIKKYIK